MSYITWKITRTPYSDDTESWDNDSEETLTSYFDVSLVRSLGTNKDSFNLKITNVNNDFDGYFNPTDKITIRRVVNSETTSSSDLIMIGSIRDTPSDRNFRTNMVSLSGYNFSEALLEAITFVDLTDLTIPLGFQRALDQVNDSNGKFKVLWHPDNPSVRSDGSDFKKIGKKFFYKRIKDIIEKYSTNEETGDGNYYWYVNEDNFLVWRKANTTSVDAFDISTDPVKKIKISKDTKGVRNYVILKGGLTPAGSPIQTYYVDWASVSKHGMKYAIIFSDKNTAQELVDQDIGVEENTATYPDLSSSFTTTWKSTVTVTISGSYGTINMVNGQFVTINTGSELGNQKAYNDVIREEIINRLKLEGIAYVNNVKYGKTTVQIDMSPGKKTWGLGDLIVVTHPDLSTLTKLMRVQEIRNFTFIDSYTLAEDEGSQ